MNKITFTQALDIEDLGGVVDVFGHPEQPKQQSLTKSTAIL